MPLFETTSRAFQATANAVDDAVWIAQAFAKEFGGKDVLPDQFSGWCGDAGHVISLCDVGLMVDDGLDCESTSAENNKRIDSHEKDHASNDQTLPTTLSTPTRAFSPRTTDNRRRSSENHQEETKEQEQEDEAPITNLLSFTLSDDAGLIIHARTNSNGDCFDDDDVSGLEELDDGEHVDEIDSCAVDAGSDINKTRFHELLYPSICLPSQLMSTGEFQTSPSSFLTPKVEVEAPSPEQDEKEEEDDGKCAKSLSDSWEKSMYFIVNVRESRNPPETMCQSMKSTSETGPLSLKNPWDETKEQN